MNKDMTNLLAQIIFEAKSYNSFEEIERLVDGGGSLSNIPLQPLYISLLNISSDQVANVLPKLSPEQRQALLDLDLWNKDIVDVNSFEYWIDVYAKCQDFEITQEFVTSEDFYLYLKSRVNIHTFDVEDPMYPDHDNYFLTDDSLLLVEYGEEYQYGNELKYLIRHMYDTLGVENAYTTIFKLINDSFSLLQETEYEAKRERLRDFGFVDYYEAREKLFPFLTTKHVDKFIQGKTKVNVKVDKLAQNQSLHSSALVSFDKEMENILGELSKVEDIERKQYLHFNFIRLINSTITLKDALRGGRLELTKIGQYTKIVLELSLQYIREQREFEKSLFDYFDFIDLYKIGHSLLEINKNRIKKAVSKSPFDSEDMEYFLGVWWNSFLENSFAENPKVKTYGAGRHAKVVDNIKTYHFWVNESFLFIELLPYISGFFNAYKEIKEEGKLNDQYYLNYEVDNIDFEAIILSSYINFYLGRMETENVNKMGLLINEFKHFLEMAFNKKEKEYALRPQGDFEESIKNFQIKYGLEAVEGFASYLYGILSEHLDGYEYDTLADEDYAHVGGPILLNSLLKN